MIVGPDNIVKGVEQRLTEANLKHIVDGTGIVRDVTYIADPARNCPLSCSEDKWPP